MAITLGAIQTGVPGNRREKTATITLDSSYPTGGYTFDIAALLGLAPTTLKWADVNPAGGYTFELNVSTQRLKAFVSGGTEVTNATNLSAIVTRIVAVGKSSR